MSLASVWLVGCGNMGAAMLARWLGAGVDATSITVVDPALAQAPVGVRLLRRLPEEPAPDVLVLAIKPQQLAAFAAGVGGWRGQPPVILSILAGVELSSLQQQLGSTRICRAMPNLPVAIGKGVVALYAGAAGVDTGLKAAAERLMQPLGHVEWMTDESLFDAVTALSGSGPGFVFRFVDALAAAGMAIGLPADMAARLALATVEGSAQMAASASDPPAMLADRVASKGGSTREGLNVLDDGEALVALLTATLAAAKRRNGELAALAR
ncbi:MAG: pyrroline-5-carboxylate reductase [Sphingomonas sp.]